LDRTFVDADGNRWVVDFKTSRHECGDVDTFLDNERTRYSPTLTRYARAIGGDRIALYFPQVSGWRDWRQETELNSNE